MGIRLSFAFLLIIVSSVLIGQGSENPFDIPDRQTMDSVDKPPERVESDNPFDLAPIQSSNSSNQTTTLPTQAIKTDSKSSTSQSFRIVATLALLLPLALLLTLFRGVFNDFFESAYRDRKFNQFFRRMNSIWIAPNILFYLYFFMSAAIFANLCLDYFGHLTLESPVTSIGYTALGMGIFFLMKHAIVYFLGDTFDVENESSRYNLLVLTFNIILGIVLTPINLLLLLGPDSIKGGVLALGIILTTLLIGLLILRALSVSNRLLTQHSLHFFMYFCTIEIAPLFIIAKLIV